MSQIETNVGKENVYVCEKCGGYTVTIDVDDGVTPFMLGCRANMQEIILDGKVVGFAPTCKGMAQSASYPKGPRPAHIPPPAWEWYKPTGTDFDSLSREMKEHIYKGGLDIRRRQAPA